MSDLVSPAPRPVVSPPPEPPPPTADDELAEARRHLLELSGELSRRFDRADWLEFLRLRRSTRR